MDRIFDKERKEFLRLWHAYHAKCKILYSHDEAEEIFNSIVLIFREDSAQSKEPKDTYEKCYDLVNAAEHLRGEERIKKIRKVAQELYEVQSKDTENITNKEIVKDINKYFSSHTNEEISAAMRVEELLIEVKDLKQEIKDRIDTELSLTKWLDELGERNDWFDNLVEYKVKGKHACLKDYVEGLEKRIEELEKALQYLYDEQNGAPLIRDKATWDEAMKLAEQALSKEE